MNRQKHCQQSNEHPLDEVPLNWAESSPSPVLEVERLDLERFERLSAYVDGEVSAAEKAEVEAWLANDPVVRQCYHSLRKLHGAIAQSPAPRCAPVEMIVSETLLRLDRDNRRRAWVRGSAVAAALAAAVAALWTSDRPVWQMADRGVPYTLSASPVKAAPPVAPRPIAVTEQALILE